MKGFTARFGPDDSDLIPEDSATGQPQKGYKFRGHMLDLRTLAFALTDVLFIRKSPWMIVFSGDKATNLVLIKGC